MAKMRAFFVAAGALSGVALVLFGLAELFCRWALPPTAATPQQQVTLRPNRSSAPHEQSTLDLFDSPENHYQGQSLYINTPQGRRLRPSTKATIKQHSVSGRSITVTTNSLGFRGGEIAAQKSAPRVLFLGDSITIGDYLEDHETFVHQVALRAKQNNINIETINTGVGSIDTMTELAILKEKGLSTKPDIVVLGFYLNDFQPSRALLLTVLPPWLAWSRLVQLTHKALASLRYKWMDNTVYAFKKQQAAQWVSEVESRFSAIAQDSTVGASDTPFAKEVLHNKTDWGLAWSTSAWQHMGPLIAEFKSIAQAHGFKPVIVMFPAYPQVVTTPDNIVIEPQRRMQSLAKANGIAFLDLLPHFRELHSRKNWTHGPQFYDQCHHSAAVNEEISRWIWDFLRSMI
jgi:hypothetical protein